MAGTCEGAALPRLLGGRSGRAARRAARLGAVVAGGLALTACAVKPEPLTLAEQISLAASDRAAIYASQEPLSGPVSLEEAMARALKYNLDHRVTMMERALEERLTESASLELLPQLAGRAGLRTRDNTQASSSRSVETGRQSLEPSTSTDRDLGTADLQLSLNVLDFGLSYYGAKAQGNRQLAAEERRRRLVLTIADQVRAAYWEAVTAQELAPRVRSVLAEARSALAFAREAETQRLLPPLQTLQYQRTLLEIVQQLEALEGEMAAAKTQLASLMNLPPSTEYRLAPPRRTATRLPYRVADLEAVAMVERPEIRERIYTARNVALETRSEILKLLPGANLFAGVNYDSNSFLLNNSWADAGVQVTWNLLRLLTVPAIMAQNEAKTDLAETQRLALRMAVLTQVNLAYRRHQQATRAYARASEILDVENRIAQAARSAEESDAQSRLERVRAASAAVLAQRARNRAFAEVQNALGAVYASAGFDPLPNVIDADDVAGLARAIGEATALIQSGRAPLPAPPPANPPRSASAGPENGAAYAMLRASPTAD